MLNNIKASIDKYFFLIASLILIISFGILVLYYIERGEELEQLLNGMQDKEFKKFQYHLARAKTELVTQEELNKKLLSINKELAKELKKKGQTVVTHTWVSTNLPDNSESDITSDYINKQIYQKWLYLEDKEGNRIPSSLVTFNTKDNLWSYENLPNNLILDIFLTENKGGEWATYINSRMYTAINGPEEYQDKYINLNIENAVLKVSPYQYSFVWSWWHPKLNLGVGIGGYREDEIVIEPEVNVGLSLLAYHKKDNVKFKVLEPVAFASRSSVGVGVSPVSMQFINFNLFNNTHWRPLIGSLQTDWNLNGQTFRLSTGFSTSF